MPQSPPTQAPASHGPVDFDAPTRPRQRPRLMVFWDVGVALGVVGLLVWGQGLQPDRFISHAAIAVAVLLGGPLTIYVMGGYETATRPLGSGPMDWGRLMLIAATVLWVVMLTYEWRGGDTDLGILAAAWPILGTGWYMGRLLGRKRLTRSPQNTLVVGSGLSALHVVDIIGRHPEHGLRVVGLVDDRPGELPAGAPPVVGGLAELPYLMRSGNVKRVIVAYGHAPDNELVEVLRRASHTSGVRTQIVPRLWELVDHDAHVDALGAMVLIEVATTHHSCARACVKRAFDMATAALGLVLASPLLAVIAIAIRRESPGSAIFRQTRVGRDGHEFAILKFRSMFTDADREGLAAEIARADRGERPVVDIREASARMKDADDPRITRVGRFIRRTSLDELPQLWNVLRGDMSIVGPRPLRPYEVATLTDWQLHRHDVRPGITGSWQVLGRSDITWEERMQMDFAYARKHSLRQDLRILARTANVVFGAKGAR